MHGPVDQKDDARFLPPWEIGDVAGAVVAIDVIRAFSTAAYAFAGEHERSGSSQMSTSHSPSKSETQASSRWAKITDCDPWDSTSPTLP